MIEQKVDNLFPQVVEWRRYLHQNPELSFQEIETSKYIVEELSKMAGVVVTQPTKTSVMGRLKGKKGVGKTIAMRGDIDALPIQEETDLPYASTNEGIMHACGHDGHTSILLGTAQVLSDMQEEISGEYVFIFQHAEEVPPGGAAEMVEAGVLEGVDLILGMHLWSTAPVGEIHITEGAITSASDVFDITVTGKAGHSSQPEGALDALAIGTQIVTNLQHIVSRHLAPLESGVVSVTRFHSGSAYNVIPDKAIIGGSVRSLTEDVRKKIKSYMENVCTHIAAAHGASAELAYQFGYDPIVNDSKLTSEIFEFATKNFTNETVKIVPPLLGGEDFSAFSNVVPGCFVGIGAMKKREGVFYPHHHPRFEIDESALKIGIRYYVSTALHLMNNQEG